MKPLYSISVAVASAFSLTCGNVAAAPAPAIGSEMGTWVNPAGSVKVETSRCGDKLCGRVVWANETAKADAAEGGVPQLIGTAVLRNYTNTRPRHWKGQVFVPDLGETYYSTITQLDANRIKISGCILGGLICKSQIWRRV